MVHPQLFFLLFTPSTLVYLSSGFNFWISGQLVHRRLDLLSSLSRFEDKMEMFLALLLSFGYFSDAFGAILTRLTT